MNLGGFDNCVFNHDKERAISIFFSIDEGGYGFSLRKNSAESVSPKQPQQNLNVHLQISDACQFAASFPLQ